MILITIWAGVSQIMRWQILSSQQLIRLLQIMGKSSGYGQIHLLITSISKLSPVRQVVWMLNFLAFPVIFLIPKRYKRLATQVKNILILCLASDREYISYGLFLVAMSRLTGLLDSNLASFSFSQNLQSWLTVWSCSFPSNGISYKNDRLPSVILYFFLRLALWAPYFHGLPSKHGFASAIPTSLDLPIRCKRYCVVPDLSLNTEMTEVFSQKQRLAFLDFMSYVNLIKTKCWERLKWSRGLLSLSISLLIPKLICKIFHEQSQLAVSIKEPKIKQEHIWLGWGRKESWGAFQLWFYINMNPCFRRILAKKQWFTFVPFNITYVTYRFIMHHIKLVINCVTCHTTNVTKCVNWQL